LKKTITFIINPISGNIDKENFPLLIKKNIDLKKFDCEALFTESSVHTLLLAKEAVAKKRTIIVAVGGDGTINNIAKYVKSSPSLFAMIPMGSGNGLARHLNIPMNKQRALQIINNLKTTTIDTAKANDDFFINIAGAGFDAHVSKLFASTGNRGLWSYVNISMNEFIKYKPVNYKFFIDGKEYNEDAFLICVANGSQFGNNAVIAPEADLSDGMLEISLIKPFHKMSMPFIGFDLFSKKFNSSRFVKTYKGKNIIIKRPDADVMNIDGEPVMMDKDIDIRIEPSSINVIVP